MAVHLAELQENLDSGYKGRQQGSRNWTDADTNHFLTILEQVLPIEEKAWSRIRTAFNQWAEKHG